MKNHSIWNKDISYNNCCLENFHEISTDILIIGGGITGLSTAYFLKDCEKDILLVDKGNIGCGVTSKSTAKITFLQGDIYQTLEKVHGKKISKKYFDSQKEAINLIRDILCTNDISCDLECVDSIVFTTKHSGISKIQKEKELIEGWNVSVEDVFHDKIKAGIKVSGTYTFNPVQYMRGLLDVIKEKVGVYEGVGVRDIKKEKNGYLAFTNKGVIHASHIVVACHYPFFLVPTLIPLKTYIKREYVVAACSSHEKYSAINIDKSLHSIRYYKDYLIYGSNEQRLTNKLDYSQGYKKSRKDFQKYFHLNPKYSWMNQDIVSNDYLPFIGEIDRNMYLATAYNAWGMTNGTLAGKMICDLILTGKSPYQDLFHPKRWNFPLIGNSFLGSFHYLKAYIEAFLQKKNPRYIKIKGFLYGVYTDSSLVKHKVKLLCPHMKCSLVFNQEEMTWDCPCHGSRFDLDGHLIEGPAKTDICDKSLCHCKKD